MVRHSLILLALLALSGVTGKARATPDQSGAATGANSDPTYIQLRNIKVGNESIHVKDFTLKKDAGTFTFPKNGFDITRRLIYPKGAYILQMVRFMMRQRDGDPDARFKALMRDFTRTYPNRIASTQDFKAVLEKHMTPEMDIDGNHKMNWFFDEYVYGTEFPTYKFEHSFSTDASGDVVFNFKITQSGVSKDFVMLVPIYLDLGNGRIMWLGSARVAGNNSLEQHVPLRGLKEKPKRAMLAYYDDVLANIENH